MMAAIFELALSMTYKNQLCVNRWNYRCDSIPAAVSKSFALVSAFGGIYDLIAVPPAYPADTPLGKIMALLSSGVSLQQITALAVYDALDFYQTPFVPAYVGGTAGNPASPLLAYGFRSTQSRRDVARGTKRFVGVDETRMGDGGLVAEGETATMLNAIAAAMTDNLVYDDEGTSITFQPLICSKFEYDPNPTDPEANHRAYKYWATEAEQLAHSATGIIWQAYDYVRSQTSRQYGRGR